MKNWKDEEVKNLFTEVENCKKENIALRNAFDAHARKFARKTNSVRNYYYQEVENLKQDKERAARLEIDLSKHEKEHYVSFDNNEEKKLLEQVGNLTKQGVSIRNACEQISGGDLTLMTRLQNKVQSMKKKSLRKDNVILFSQRKPTLSENDINSLFIGLVKLIKKTALDEVSAKMKEDLELLKLENRKLNEKLNKYLRTNNRTLKLGKMRTKMV